MIAVVTRRAVLGEGAGGYGARLLAHLPGSTPVGLGEEPGLRFAWRHRYLTRRYERVLSLERTVDHDLVRVGGGVDADAAAALGRRPSWRTRALEDRCWSVGTIVANSRMVADALRRRTPRPIHVVRTGVDLQRFRPGERTATGVVLFAGHGWRRKGFREAVEVMATQPERRLWVAGRDARRSRHLRWARDVLGDRVVDLGPRADLAPLLPRVDAVLHLTRYDPASNLVIEAMACGTPVVTTDRDGSAEVLPTELVSRGDPVRALREALAGGEALSRELRRRAMDWPDSRNVEELEALLWESR